MEDETDQAALFEDDAELIEKLGEALRLAPIGGDRVVIGFAGLVDGPLDATGAKEAALTKARATGFLDSSDSAGDVE